MDSPDQVAGIAEALSDYEAQLEAGESPDLGTYRTLLGSDFQEFAALVDVRSELIALIEPATTDALPRSFGDYTLLRVLGKGGAGVVYEARNERLDRLEAVKVLHREAADAPTAGERFRREARIIARVEHPNVVRIHQSGVIDGRPFIAMELIEGTTLKQWAADNRQPNAAEFCRRSARVADALEALHAEGSVHRDVKPSNIMVRHDGSFVLMDFGLVRDNLQTTLTASRQLVGTPYYMSPEQLRGEGVSATSDVYSLGATLYHGFTGAPPFKARTLTELVSKALKARPEHLARKAPETPKAVSDIVMKCLERDAGDRYPSAAALRDDLRAYAEGKDVRGKPLSAWRRAGRVLLRHAIPLGAAAALVTVALVIWMNRGGTLQVDTPGYVANLAINEAAVGETPRSVSLASGDHRLALQVPGFKPFKERVEIDPGADLRIVYRVEAMEPELDSLAAVRLIGKAIGAPVRGVSVELDRGPGDVDAAALLVYPRGKVQPEDLKRLRLEVYDPHAVSEGAQILIRLRGGDELARVPVDHTRVVTENDIPEAVRRGAKPGGTLEFVLRHRGETLVSTVDVAAADPQLESRLAELEDRLQKQPEWTRAYFRWQALLDHGHYEKVRAESAHMSRTTGEEAARSVIPSLLSLAALKGLAADGSRLAAEIRERAGLDSPVAQQWTRSP